MNIQQFGALSGNKGNIAKVTLWLNTNTLGQWEQHSISVAKNTRLITAKTGIMHCDNAYI